MRLTCENCNAQYEIDARAVPATGRQVQCSSCGFGWFQTGMPVPPDEPSADWEMEEPVAEEVQGARVQKRPKDAAMVDLLREEARRELLARKRDAAPIEMQGEFDLDAMAPGLGQRLVEPEVAAPDRTAGKERPLEALVRSDTVDGPTPERKKAADANQPPPTPIPADPDAKPVRPARPLISPDDAAAPFARVNQAAEHDARRAFRQGFASVVVIAGIGVGAYAFAPNISASVPALAGPLDSYVTLCTRARAAIDSGQPELATRLTG